nr:immunoglobulin light chain junction region [Macaca mulatta]MPN90795.1 immunoglobulin light chain junction region [Macaca mulatta]MPN90801.1 immunoglobulin light chain junction region [Macaca mulatta]MPN90835.1 immunoglobulin light chain junction region [Macaca mulatta]MPN90846.1 immunoglobulin light chain junction region [Macaca mulatta]
CQHGYGIPFTF